MTALDSIEAGRWGRADLVDGFDSRHACPDPADPAARCAMRPALPAPAGSSRNGKLRRDALIDSDLRRRRDDASDRRADGDRRAASQLYPKGTWSMPSSRTHPARSPSCDGARSSNPASRSARDRLRASRVFRPRLRSANPDDEGSRRAALADWLASPKNVLTWRSIANRLWHYHFGRGIVETPNDFGRNGARPTHPELLDWLAAELRDHGESLKALHRLIVCSAVYRQASRDNPAFAAIDADNRYLWRQNRRRLDAEAIRDSVLAVSGTLDRRMGGPASSLFISRTTTRRSTITPTPPRSTTPRCAAGPIYRFIVRSVPNPFMEALDCADPNLNTPVRSQTLTALQALALWNDLFMVRQSQEFARRLEQQHRRPARAHRRGLSARARPRTRIRRARRP